MHSGAHALCKVIKLRFPSEGRVACVPSIDSKVFSLYRS